MRLVSTCTQIGSHALSVQLSSRLSADFHGSTRARNSSKPARPYICRLIIFSRLMWPSTGPLLPTGDGLLHALPGHVAAPEQTAQENDSQTKRPRASRPRAVWRFAIAAWRE